MQRLLFTALACLFSFSVFCQNSYSIHFDGINDYVEIPYINDYQLDQDFTIQITDADAIVLAGDIYNGTRAIPWINQQTDKPVIYIAGNHEYYGELCPELKYKLEKACNSNFSYTRVIKDEKTGEESTVAVVKDTEKNLKLLADSWRMAQEIDKAIPVLEQAAKMSKEGETYILLGNLYLFEDRIEDSIRAIEAGLKKGKVKSESQAQLVLGQAHFEMENFENHIVLM